MAAGAAGAGVTAPRGFWSGVWGELRREVPAPKHKPNPKSWPDRGLHIAWLGHSSTIIKVDGFTILTDPVLTNYAGLHIGPMSLGIKRVRGPAVTVDDLPKVDLILLSHAHMDHLDTRTLRSLESKSTQVLTAWETSDLLRVGKFQSVRELRWGQVAQAGEARVKALEVNHWGARYRTDTFRGYNGYLIEVGSRRVLFAGDTADTDAFREVKSSRPPEVGIIPIGAYNPWIRYHCNPEQAWRIGNDAGAEVFIPVHHQTFRLGREPYTEPIERLMAAAKSSTDRVAMSEIGQELHL